MSLPIFIAIIASIAFGTIALIFSREEERTKKLLHTQEEQEKQREYESEIISQIQDTITHSLDVEQVLAVIAENLDKLVKYSSVCTTDLKNEMLVFKIHTLEPVSHIYINQRRDSMHRSLSSLSPDGLPDTIEEHHLGVELDDTNQFLPVSYFQAPLVVGERALGIIGVSSTKLNAFTQEEMVKIYKIVNLASESLTRLETILASEEGKLTAMIGSLTDGVFMVDEESQLTIINNAARIFLNIRKKDPTIIDVLAALPNTYDFAGKIKRAISQNEPIEEKEVIVGERAFQIFITPVHDASRTLGQNVIGASILLHDISLQKSVAQMKEDFTNIIVHELRSPLTAIKASTQLLVSPKTQLSDEEKGKLIHLIKDQTNKILDEVSLILDAAKLESGLFTVNKVPSDLTKIIKDRVAVFIPQAQEKLVKLVVDVDPSIPHFSFDPNHIGQVINNLVSNSLKFTSHGGSIHVKAKEMRGKVVVSVSDTGAGIPKEKQKFLFSRFSQVSTPNAHVGTGLGLYFVKGIIEAHGGTVSLDSEEGHGTTITFTLPIHLSIKSALTPPRLAVQKPQNLTN